MFAGYNDGIKYMKYKPKLGIQWTKKSGLSCWVWMYHKLVSSLLSNSALRLIIEVPGQLNGAAAKFQWAQMSVPGRASVIFAEGLLWMK